MGFAGDFLGITPNTGAGGAGANYVAGATPLLNPTTTDQTATAYSGSQDALEKQKAFLAALQAQNGIGNQSSVYNQLQGIANGTGPNPAQAALAQATSANVANQAALMAGQRGAGANVGLIARQAAQQGAQTQQQAAGQSATLQAQQQANAINTMGGIAGQQVSNQAAATSGLNQFQQNEQQNLLNSVAQYNNANVAQQASQNSANSGVANTVAGTQGKLFSGIINGAGSAAAMSKGGQVPSQNNYAFGTDDLGVAPMQPSYPAAPGPRSNAAQFLKGFKSNTPRNRNADAPGSEQSKPNPLGLNQKDPEEQAGETIGRGLGKGAKAIGGAFSSDDNSDPSSFRYDTGDYGANSPGIQSVDVSSGIGADLPELMSDGGDVGTDEQLDMIKKLAPLAMMLSKGGLVDALLSPGELYLSPDKARKVAASKNKGKEIKKEAKRVPGQAKVKGDSLKNDIVPAKLEEGGIVIPRSVVQSKDAAKNCAAFVAAHLSKHGMGMKRG